MAYCKVVYSVSFLYPMATRLLADLADLQSGSGEEESCFSQRVLSIE